MDIPLEPLLYLVAREPHRWRVLRVCARLLQHERRKLDLPLSTTVEKLTDDESALVCLFGLFCRHGHCAEVVDFAKVSTGIQRAAAVTALAEVGHVVDGNVQSEGLAKLLRELLAKVPATGDPELARPPDETDIAIADLVADVTVQAGLHALIALLEYSDPAISKLAQQAILRIGLPASDKLYSALPRLPVASKAKAIKILTQFADRRVLDFLCDAFAADPLNVTETGINALATLGGERALHALRDAAIHGRHQALAIAALARCGQTGIDVVLSTFRSVHSFRIAAGRNVGRSIGAPALTTLAEAFDDPRRVVRNSAEEGLQELGVLAVAQLMRRLKDASSDTDMRVRAIRLLARTQASEAAETLMLIAEQVAGLERLAAIEALGSYPGDQAMDIASAAANSSDKRLRKAGKLAVQAFVSAMKPASDSAPKFESQQHPIDGWLDSFNKIREHSVPRPPAPQADHEIGSEVYFSVTAPQRVMPMQAFALDLWVHAERDSSVLKRSLQLDIARIRRLVQTVGPAYIQTGVRLDIELSIPDLDVTDENSLSWGGAPGNCNFTVVVPNGVTHGSHAGVVVIRANQLRIAKVSFLIEVAEQPSDIVEDVTSHDYRPLRWFASYASEDRTDVMGRIQGMQKVVPELDIFVDVASLRSGTSWSARIVEEITARDGLYLFWSRAAMHSPHVDMEWRTAFKLKGIEGINPVPLVSPSEAPPPAELSSLHFNEWTLAFQK